jgi:hypothetical protein
MTLRFTWSRVKAASNLRKHHVGFEIASRVFLDPFALSDQDRIEAGEARWQTIGSVDGVAVLLIAHTVRDDLLIAHTVCDDAEGTEVIHIISARRAERGERRRYEEARYRELRT